MYGNNGINELERGQIKDSFGTTCQIAGTAIARLYTAYPNDFTWNYTCTGFVTILTDFNLGSHYLRVLDVQSYSVMFEQEFYSNFLYSSLTPWFHAFEMDDQIGGLSFADEQEAQRFYNGVMGLKNRPPPQQQAQSFSAMTPQYPTPAREPMYGNGLMRAESQIGSFGRDSLATPPQQYGLMRAESQIGSFGRDSLVTPPQQYGLMRAESKIGIASSYPPAASSIGSAQMQPELANRPNPDPYSDMSKKEKREKWNTKRTGYRRTYQCYPRQSYRLGFFQRFPN